MDKIQALEVLAPVSSNPLQIAVQAGKMDTNDFNSYKEEHRASYDKIVGENKKNREKGQSKSII